MSWLPRKQRTIDVAAAEKIKFDQAERESRFLRYRFPTLKGINRRGEFPVAVVRQVLDGERCEIFVSAQSKHGVPCYLLERLPGVRRRADPAYTTTVDVFGADVLERFHRRAALLRRQAGLRGAGGDPDLLVRSARGRPFFVEVKLEDLSGPRPYRDRLHLQQHVLFPLIEAELGCDVWVYTVRVS